MLKYSALNKSYIFDRGYCHRKVNSIAQQSQLNLSSILQAKHQQTLSLPRISRLQTVNDSQEVSTKRKRTEYKRKVFKNPEFDHLESQKIAESQMLSKKIKQLKQMHLLNKNKLKNVRYQGQNKRGSILNDFHSSKTNGGYGRSKTGGIYYK